jgi:hypothetical protein
MAKKKKASSLNIHDFFGTYNTYRIFALQSELSVFPFANQLGKAEKTTFTILHDFDYSSNQYSAYFSVFYAEYSQQDSIHCLLLQNKAIINNQEEHFVSKAEKNLSFQTLSLFDEYLYLFNNQGLRCFDAPLENVDYLLLLFAKKDIENEMFLQFIHNISLFNAKDASFLLERVQTSAEQKVSSFLKDFYCKYEVKANRLSRNRAATLLAPVKKIPILNQQFPIPVRLENEALAENMQLSEEYVRFLEGE